MKRLLLIAFPLAVLIACGLFIWWKPYAPRFKRIGSSFVPPKSDAVSYAGHAAPSVGGKLWITARASTNRAHYYLFDIERKKVIGELVGATPVFSDPDYAVVLCMQRGAVHLTFKDKLKALWERVLGRGNPNRLSFPREMETFWAVDLNRRSATYLGERKTIEGASSSFTPSPTARYAMSQAIDPATTSITFFCDLTRRRWWTQTNWPTAWWDDENVIRKTRAGDLELVNIKTAATRTLLPRGRFSSFLLQHGLVADSSISSPHVFPFRNGSQFEFYLSDGQHFYGDEISFLIRLCRPDATLELVTKVFEFEQGGQFDETGTRYVSAPRNVGQCCNGVSIRDLNAKTDRVLVPATSSATMNFPRFYRDSIIYSRSNTLWRIDVNGSNHVRLYPPTVKERSDD